jgi:hypothetical protein
MDLAEGHVAALRCMETLGAFPRRGPETVPDSSSWREQGAAPDSSIPPSGASTNDASMPLVINLGAGRGYSVLEMVRAFEAASGRTIPYRIVGRRPGDIATCYADPSLARTLLGWQARRTLADMCADTWRWQSANPDGIT